ncbi:hypothetical protein MTR67_015109 [Solanum verrucosum]|uniref:Uncharacterized protein n=1 Tax=Solanum verrucosum TaxID=315347 RepID=A0AAF0QKU6_SOLVR|nr:hypothetical protein MTR67_015109 [Solanum verrucosum]
MIEILGKSDEQQNRKKQLKRTLVNSHGFDCAATIWCSLDKRASLLDVIVEGQDLEKFSVFYRFARFHGRGQSSGAESSSTDASAHSHKPFLQRYVSAFPMPQNLPDRPLATSMPGFSLVTPASGKEWSHIKPGFEIYMLPVLEDEEAADDVVAAVLYAYNGDGSCWKSRYNGITLKATCPVCLQVLSTPLDSDLKMTLATHELVARR